MKKISESNIYPNFNLLTEYKKIRYLLSEKKIISESDLFNMFSEETKPSISMSIEDFVDKYFFNWHLRGTFVSVQNMREELGIENSQMMSTDYLNEEPLLNFLQYVVNCAKFVDNIYKKNSYHDGFYLDDKNHINVVMGDTERLLKYLGCRLSYDENNDEYFVVYSDEILDVVSMQQQDIEHSLSEYLRIDNHGDLKRKGEILCSLFKKLESVEKKFKGTEFSHLISDATFLFNKTGIRHWVEKDKIAVATFEQMTESEKEIWYDRTYYIFLSCMAALPYLEIKADIKSIKLLGCGL